MDFPQLRRELDSLHHRITRRPSAFLGRHPPIELENAVRVGKPGIRQGVFWIELNRLLETPDGSPQRRRRALMPQVPTFQIKLISLDVAGRAPRTASEGHLETFGDRACDLVLDCENVLHLAVVP